MKPPTSDFQYPEDDEVQQEPIAPQVEPDDDRRSRDEAIIAFFENAFHILNAYQAHQTTSKQLRMSLRAMELALGFHLAAGAEGPAELARQMRMQKWTVNKCLNHFLAQLKLAPLPFQRKPEARKNMSEARKAQIKKP